MLTMYKSVEKLRHHYRLEIQEIVMTVAYENKFILDYNILLFNSITLNCSLHFVNFCNWKKSSSFKRLFPPHILYVFKFSHHSTAFLVETNSQCSSYIRHFFVYKAVICQVVFPHKLKQRAFPSFDCAFFFYLFHFFSCAMRCGGVFFS